jgi:acyl dehydratase
MAQRSPEMLEKLAKARSMIGIERPTRAWNEVATKDAIWHFATGFGDLNPLWVDEDYARQTRYGCIIAPPTFPYSCSSGPLWIRSTKSRGTGLPGMGGVWAGDTWEFFQPVRINDTIKGFNKLLDIVEKESRFSGIMWERLEETTYRNQRGEIVAKCVTSRMISERRAGGERGKYRHIPRHRYTKAELKAIEKDYDAEERRGATPRYYEDVKVGDIIPQLVKGPLTVTELITFHCGTGGPFLMANKIAHMYIRDHPAACIPDSETNVPDFPERFHWDDSFAQEIGFPRGMDTGGQRIAWLAQVVTNWMGDDGFLAKLKVRFRSPNLIGDTTWCRGEVTGKRAEGSDHVVECELWGENQDKVKSVVGRATVILPSKSEVK